MENPFVTMFGGSPNVVFGREEIIDNFRRGLSNKGSVYRTVFLTGRRGTGKTTLLTKLVSIAGEAGWRTVDILSMNAAAALFAQIRPEDEIIDTTDPKISAQVLGTGGSISGRSVTKVKRRSIEELPDILIEACKEEPQGICIALDEIQKISLEDMALICASIQKASRYGSNIVLIAAGLPGSYERFAENENSNTTYIQRAQLEELGLLSLEEVISGYKDVFDAMDGIVVIDDLVLKISKATYGYPYLVQLIGYALIDIVKEKRESMLRYSVGKQDLIVDEDEVAMAIEQGTQIHIDNVIVPATRRLRGDTVMFLKNMAKCYQEDGFARSSDVYKMMGKNANQLSTVRGRLIKSGLIYSPERNKLAFALPYLRQYVDKMDPKPKISKGDETLIAWKL